MFTNTAHDTKLDKKQNYKTEIHRIYVFYMKRLSVTTTVQIILKYNVQIIFIIKEALPIRRHI